MRRLGEQAKLLEQDGVPTRPEPQRGSAGHARCIWTASALQSSRVRRQAHRDALRPLASEALTPVIIHVTRGDLIPATVRTVATLIRDRGLTGLINNASISQFGPLEFLPSDDHRPLWEVNVVETTQSQGLFFVCFAAVGAESYRLRWPTAVGGNFRLRCVTTPDGAQKELLDRLGLTLPQRLRRIDEVAQTWPRILASNGLGAIVRADSAPQPGLGQPARLPYRFRRQRRRRGPRSVGWPGRRRYETGTGPSRRRRTMPRRANDWRTL